MAPPVELLTTRCAPERRALSSTLMVPSTFTRASKAGSAADLRTSIWAARWKTTSGWAAAHSEATATASRTSISASSAPPSRAPARFSRRPVETSSRTVTSSPRSSRASTRFEPMNPAPPVTRARMKRGTLEGRQRRSALVASAAMLVGTEDQPQAHVALSAALASVPSHAYLFHGPAGSGKRTVARSFAAELLAEGDADPDSARHRVHAGTHPDLTWVKPTGAAQMRAADVEGPVVAAAARAPFESSRRVFVLERVDTMNDTVANRLLKTLEEPASFVHLILLTDRLSLVIDTVASRCQPVRFDPLPPARVADTLQREGVEAEKALACARLAAGNAERARMLASEEGDGLREDAEAMVAGALSGGGLDEPWRALLERAERHREEAEQASSIEREQRLELEPQGRERKALERELEEAARRDARRARTEVLELGLELAAMGFRDLVAVA